MKPFNSNVLVPVGLFVIGLLCAGSAMAVSKASAETRPGNESTRQGGLSGLVHAPLMFGQVSKHQETIRSAQKAVQMPAEESRNPSQQRSSRSSTQGYHMWLGRCWKGGGSIAMAFPPQSILPSYFNPFWTRVSMRFCADVKQPASQ